MHNFVWRLDFIVLYYLLQNYHSAISRPVSAGFFSQFWPGKLKKFNFTAFAEKRPTVIKNIQINIPF